jgi:hypothetical protein
MPVSTIQNASLASGVPSAAKLPAGSVLQVVNYSTVGTGVSTTSTSFVTTGYSVTITPTSSSSKILVLVNSNLYTPQNDGSLFTIYRGGTNVAGTGLYALTGSYGSNSNLVLPVSMQYLDSPATTSATTYTVYYRTSSGTLYFGFASGGSVAMGINITALEIAA